LGAQGVAVKLSLWRLPIAATRHWAIAPPRVALESVVLTLRHVNAMLLGAFFRRQASQPLKLTAGAFFDHNAAEGEAPWRQFVDWLAADGSVAKIGWSGCPVLMGKGI
jgi:hypothetical protein